MHAGVNDAALRLADKGRVQAIGCMVGGEAWRGEWLARLRSLDRGAVDIGLHLDLTERPLLPGTGGSLAALAARAWLHRLDPNAVRTEIRAQLDAFGQAIGAAPAFVDGHRHVHQFAVVRQILLAEITSRYSAQLPWLRSTRAPRDAGAWRAGGWPTQFKARVIEALGSAATVSMATQFGLRHNRCLLGVYDFQGGADRYRALLAGWIASAGDADLLMCHAAGPTHSDAASDALIAARRAEFEVLDSAALDALLNEAGLQLAPMSRILARPRALTRGLERAPSQS